MQKDKQTYTTQTSTKLSRALYKAAVGYPREVIPFVPGQANRSVFHTTSQYTMRPVALFWLFCVGCALAGPASSLEDSNQVPPLTQKDPDDTPLKSTSSDEIILEKQPQTSAEVPSDGPESKIKPDRNGRNYNVPEGWHKTQDGFHMQEGFEGYLVPTAGMHYGAFAIVPWVIFVVGLGIFIFAHTPILLLPLAALLHKKIFLLKLLNKVIFKLKKKKPGRMMPSSSKLAELTNNVFQAVQKYGQMQSLEE